MPNKSGKGKKNGNGNGAGSPQKRDAEVAEKHEVKAPAEKSAERAAGGKKHGKK